MKHFFATLPGRLLASLLIFVIFGGAVVRSADVVDNWSFLEPGVLPSKVFVGADGSLFAIGGLKAGGVVDAKSTPANPFEGATRALSVEPGPVNAGLRIFSRPFPDETPAKGFYEFEFRLVEGGFNFNPEFFSGSSDPKGTWYKAGPDQVFGFAFIPRAPIIVSPPRQNLVTEDFKVLATEENYAFRVEWQTSGDNLEFHFLLNGKPLTAANGAEFSISVPQSKIEGAVLGFRLTSGSEEGACFTGFLGSIRAGALAP